MNDDFINILYELFKTTRANNSFSTGSIARAANSNRHKVLRVCRTLQKLKFIARMPVGFKQRVFRITRKFPTEFPVLLEYYENYKLLTRPYTNIKVRRKEVMKDEREDKHELASSS